MNIPRSKKALLLMLALAFILACSRFAAPTPQPAATLDALYTAAAQTLGAMSTQGAVTLTAQQQATGTLFIPTSSVTPFSTLTPVPPLQTIIPCDAASFITDVTYPDGSIVSRGSSFTKTWRIKNIGACAWTTSYALVFVSGEKFGAPNAVSLPASIGPGQTVDLSVNMTAPNNDGSYQGNWKLRNPSGTLFGVGSGGNVNIYVDVNVTGYTVTAYDFIAGYCDAAWENDSRSLPCPGTEGDNDGFVRVLTAPKIENGSVQEKALLTYPQKSNRGFIMGTYPGLNVQNGDRFQASISCQYKANDCDAIFRLSYQVGKGAAKTLGQWREVYEGQHYSVNIDVSSLSGQKVKFILTVLTNGSSHEDFALWIAPRITRQSSQPPTATFTSTIPVNTSTPTVTSTPTATGTPTSTPTATGTPTETATATPTP